MSAATALAQIQSILETNLTAVKVHQFPPESLSTFPSMVLEWTGGSTGLAEGGSYTNRTATLLAALYINRQVIMNASETVRPYIDSFESAIADNAPLITPCGASVETLRWQGPGLLTYNRNEYYGIRFEMDVRFQDNATWPW